MTIMECFVLTEELCIGEQSQQCTHLKVIMYRSEKYDNNKNKC